MFAAQDALQPKIAQTDTHNALRSYSKSPKMEIEPLHHSFRHSDIPDLALNNGRHAHLRKRILQIQRNVSGQCQSPNVNTFILRLISTYDGCLIGLTANTQKHKCIHATKRVQGNRISLCILATHIPIYIIRGTISCCSIHTLTHQDYKAQYVCMSYQRTCSQAHASTSVLRLVLLKICLNIQTKVF